MYLLDTNIFLELLLEQERADEVEQLLRSDHHQQLHVSEFTLYSIGIILFRHQSFEISIQFVDDLSHGGIRTLRLPANRYAHLADAAQRFNLDFDDAYQYATAQTYDLDIVTYDTDFDRTDSGRGSPAQIIP